MNQRGDERRRAPRTGRTGDIVGARVRPGRDVAVINISSDGALIETSHRLLPGAVVDLQLDRSARRVVIRGRVLRCTVAAVAPTSLVYHGAIAFERPIGWCAADEPGEGNRIPGGDGGPVAGHRAVVTRTAEL